MVGYILHLHGREDDEADDEEPGVESGCQRAGSYDHGSKEERGEAEGVDEVAENG